MSWVTSSNHHNPLSFEGLPSLVITRMEKGTLKMFHRNVLGPVRRTVETSGHHDITRGKGHYAGGTFELEGPGTGLRMIGGCCTFLDGSLEPNREFHRICIMLKPVRKFVFRDEDGPVIRKGHIWEMVCPDLWVCVFVCVVNHQSITSGPVRDLSWLKNLRDRVNKVNDNDSSNNLLFHRICLWSGCWAQDTWDEQRAWARCGLLQWSRPLAELEKRKRTIKMFLQSITATVYCLSFTFARWSPKCEKRRTWLSVRFDFLFTLF